MALQSSTAHLPQVVTDHLAKAKDACLAAVTNYNRPGTAFRTRTYTVLMVIAWTALFHAVFHRRGKKPWYVAEGDDPNVRYQKIDGEPKHWELAEAVRRYYGGEDTPERRNLEFMVALRNKIEHRDHPELDPALQSSAATDLLDFIRQFRAGLPQEVLESSSYSLRVFLVPKLANRAGTADLSVEFVPFDRSRPEEMEGLKKVAALIKEKHVQVASSGLMKPGEVVRKLAEGLPFQVTMHTHTQAWRVYGVRPGTDAEDPRDTRSQYCLYDDLSGSYGYTQAWVDYLRRKLSDPQEFERVTGAPPVETDRAVI